MLPSPPDSLRAVNDRVLDQDEVQGQIRGLLESWDEYRRSGVRAREGTNVGNFVIAYAFAANTYRAGKAVQLLMANGAGSECLPLVRAMYEFAITAQWVMQVDGAGVAFVTKSLYEKRKTIVTVPALNMPNVTSESVKQALEEIDDDDLRTPIEAHFKAVCLDLDPEGEAANANYRVMSAYCHPSEFLIGRYFDFSDESRLPEKLDEPDLPPLSAWANLTLTSLMWAGQAIEFADPQHERRSQLQAAETLLGTARILRPSARAFLR